MPRSPLPNCPATHSRGPSLPHSPRDSTTPNNALAGALRGASSHPSPAPPRALPAPRARRRRRARSPPPPALPAPRARRQLLSPPPLLVAAPPRRSFSPPLSRSPLPTVSQTPRPFPLLLSPAALLAATARPPTPAYQTRGWSPLIFCSPGDYGDAEEARSECNGDAAVPQYRQGS